ncbi:MAG: PHP domain-containing protein [Fimbriimonadaceae bacterium]
MRPAGSEILARWREAGEWWAGEPAREIVRYLDHEGIRRERTYTLPLTTIRRDGAGGDSADEPLLPNGQHRNDTTDFSEEWSLRLAKVRDEKVARACGLISQARENLLDCDPHSDTAPATDFSPSQIHLSTQIGSKSGYAPLHLYSGYAFGCGTMLAEEIPVLAAHAGLRAAALVDPHSLVGAVEFDKGCRAQGIQPIVGTSVELACGGKLVLIARSKRGYVSLSRLATDCHLEEPRLYPLGSWERLERHTRDVLCLTGGDTGPLDRLVVRRQFAEARRLLDRLVGLYGRDNVFVEVERSFLPWQKTVESALVELAAEAGVRVVAGGLVTHARPEHFPVQDTLVCAHTLCAVEEVVGRKPLRHPSQPPRPNRPERALNGERYLRTPAEMASLFADRPEWLAETMRVVERCDSIVLPARTQLPSLASDPHQALREAVWAGAVERHGRVERGLERRLDFEIDRIVRLNFAGHFLVAWDFCRWARGQGFLFSGRGSVVDSAVAYCLGLSRIDAYAHRLHFDRFLPEDGSKRPDIDIDFEARRRDAVRQYIVRKYGVERVAGVAAIGAYATRGIIREVGKAMGLPNELIGFLAKRLHGGVTPDRLEAALESRPELKSSGIPKERLRWVIDMAERLMDVPRNMRAHSSGLVVSSTPLADTVPVQWCASPEVRERVLGDGDDRIESLVGPDSSTDFESRPEERGETDLFRIIQWDKRSCRHFFDKFDILCLRGQDVLAGTQQRIQTTTRRFDVEKIPLDDPEAYRAMRSGQLVGIPQSASPAMRQAHIRLRTENLHDASLVQAGIRPGVGGAVKINELIARRRGKPFTFEHPDLEEILGLTYGIVVFQEQIDQLLQKFAGYSSGEAEDIREAIHKRRREDYGRTMRDKIVADIVANGYSESVADHVVELVAGFKGYGFAQGHALAFAEISLRSIVCQQNHPAAYFAALLAAQPAGYYGPTTIANEARARGVAILPPDVQVSGETHTVESVLSPMDPKIVLPDAGIRIGLSQIRGLSADTRNRILRARAEARTLAVSAEGRTFPGNAPASVRVSAGTQPEARTSVAAAVRSTDVRTPFQGFFDFVARTRPERDELESLILCGALDRLHPNRRAMLWGIPAATDYAAMAARISDRRAASLPLEFEEPPLPEGVDDFSPAERAIWERELLDLDVERHLMAFERERVSSKGGLTTAEACRLPNRTRAFVVGNPIRLRFPPTPSGKRVVFFDLEDETGILNVTCFDAVYRRDGHTIICSPYVTVVGQAQNRDGHIAFLANRVFPYDPAILKQARSHDTLPIETADFLAR